MSTSRITSRIVGSALGIVATAVLALLLGLAFAPEWGLALLASVFLLQLVNHLRHLHALGTWIERGEAPEAPRAFGVWDDLHALLHRSRREAGRREAELARAVNRWRAAARALPEGVVILEGDRIEWLNDMAREHLGLDPARDAGMSITHLLRLPQFIAYLEGGDYAKPVEVRHADGRVLTLQVVAYGEAQRLVLSRDITRFDKLERVRREFVANVSHEMRTPLTVISGFLENLLDGPSDATARRSYALMDEQARRMLRLVEDLLTLSALESSPPPPMEEPIDMAALVERLGADARALSNGRHRIEVQNAPGIVLLGSEKEVTSAFGNLVSNAIRYTPEGGLVRLSWRAEAEDAVFEVQDSGIGIAVEHIPRLTERFYRVDRGRSRETGGTGLGLAIVKHALGRHGAALEINSRPGEGSTFRVRFSGPRVRSQEKAA